MTRPVASWWFILLFGGFFCLSTQAGTIVVTGPKAHPVVVQIEDELRANGESVRVQPGHPNPAQLLLEPDVQAVMEVEAETATVMVYAIVYAAERTRRANKEVAITSDDASGSLIAALRALDALRVLREELHARTPSDSPAEQMQDAPPETTGPTEIVGIGVGPAILWSRGGTDPVLYITPIFWIRLHPRMELSLQVDLPTGPFKIEGDAGTAEMRAYHATLALEFNPLALDGAIHLPVGIVFGAGWSTFSGNPVFPHEGVEGRLFSAIAGGRLALAVDATDHTRIRLDGTVGIYLPEQRIFFGDDIAARFGRPFVRGLLALEITLP